jgi:hypothetical protein
MPLSFARDQPACKPLYARVSSQYPDTTVPNGGVSIDGEAATTADRLIVLRLRASDPQPNPSGVTQMHITNAGGTWSRAICNADGPRSIMHP